MKKPSESEVLQMAQESVNEFYESENIRKWRTYEVRENYLMRDGDCTGLGQWAQDDLDHFQAMQMPIVTENKIAPVLDAITGFEAQNRTQVDYIPRMLNPEDQGFNDLVESAARYIEHDSDTGYLDSQAFADMATCGVGSCDFYMDYKEAPHDGNVVQERIFPGFAGWDVAAYEKNLLDANHVWRSKLVRSSEVERLLKAAKGDDYTYTAGGGISYDSFVDFFNLHQVTDVALDVIYKYQWRILMPFYRVENPFIQFAKPQQMMTQDDKFMMNYAAKAEELYGIDATEQTFNIDKDVFDEFAQDLNAIGIQPVVAELEKWRYYKADIIGDCALNVEENISQKGFTQKFMTGKFDENNRIFYGVLRSMKEPQRAYNRNKSRIEKFMSKSVLGGDLIEEDAVSDMDAFLDTKAKQESSGNIVVRPGALSSGKILPRQQNQLPQGLLESLAADSEAVPGSAGVNQAFMGQIESGDESGFLFSRKVKQGAAVLFWLLDAKKFYSVEKGRMYIDFIRVMAKNNPGRMIRNVTGESSAPFYRLFEDNIAEEYAVIPSTQPATDDELREWSKMLLQNIDKFPQLAPLALDGLPYDKDNIEQAKQALTPPPPPPPDPNSVALLQAETQYKMAQAGANTAKAKLTEAQTLTELKELQAGGTVSPSLETITQQKEKEADRSLKERELEIKEAEIAANLHGRDRELRQKDRELDIREQQLRTAQ